MKRPWRLACAVVVTVDIFGCLPCALFPRGQVLQGEMFPSNETPEFGWSRSVFIPLSFRCPRRRCTIRTCLHRPRREFQANAMDGSQYISKFTDHHTRWKAVYPIQSKDKAIDTLSYFIQDYGIHLGMTCLLYTSPSPRD